MDVLNAMQLDTNINIRQLRVDGGASANNLMMQFQADILNSAVIRPRIIETTAMGAAYLAGLATGFWGNIDELKKQWQLDRRFDPSMDAQTAGKMKSEWADAVNRAKSWIKE
jgi:glycerol kinase